MVSNASAFYFGGTGLFDIPTAYLMNNGDFNVGVDVAIQDKKRDFFVLGMDFGLLNFAEIGFKGLKFDGKDYLMADIKVILAREEGLLPGFAIGVDNIGEELPSKPNRFEQSYYAVISKRFNLPFIHLISGHIGIGNNRYMNEDHIGKYIHGVFIGLNKEFILTSRDIRLQITGELKGADISFGLKHLMKSGLMLNFAMEGANSGFRKASYHVALGFTNAELMKEISQSVELAKQAVRIANEARSEKEQTEKEQTEKEQTEKEQTEKEQTEKEQNNPK
jgi:hypothetical protein